VVDPQTGAKSCCALDKIDVTGTTCCTQSGYSLDSNGNCCNTTQQVIDPPTGLVSCCTAANQDSFGVCCNSLQILLPAIVNGQENSTATICCYNNTVDCAGFCYWQDPTSGSLLPVPFNTLDANGACCPANQRDCAGLCYDNSTGTPTPINNFNSTWGDCCPDSERGPCDRKCFSRDKYCCENPASNTDCGSCLNTNSGCGWCSSPYSSAGACYSGDLFGPYRGGATDSPCAPGNRWVVNPSSSIIASNGDFNDGWNIENKNYTVQLAPNDTLIVPFKVRVPKNIPLDLYILHDGTASFAVQDNGNPSSLQNFQAMFPALIDAIKANVSNNLMLGFGLFADKPVQPFGYWGTGNIYDYVFHNLVPLTVDTDSVVTAVGTLTNQQLIGGADIPESSLEALVEVGLGSGTKPAGASSSMVPIGWRGTSVNEVVLVVTDAPPHVASLGTTPDPSTGPYDLQWWLDNSATQLIGLSNDVKTAPTWVPNAGTGSLDTGSCTSRPSQDPATTSPGATGYPREGLCQDYPSVNQTIAALSSRNIAPVYVIADTVGSTPINSPYDVNEARNWWNAFVAQYGVGYVGDLVGRGQSNGADLLKDSILNALFAVTETVSLIQNGSSVYWQGVSPSQYTNVQPGSILEFNVSLKWDGSWPGSSGPFPVDVTALYPLTGFPIDVGHIDVYLAKIEYCGYCGDGVVQPELNEDCEAANTSSAEPGCCSSNCTFNRALCNGLSFCNPSFCYQGFCEVEPVTCTPILDAVQSLCSTNSCINGQCVVSCFGANSSLCCDDNDTCTVDSCVAGVCRHDPKLECDCGGNPAYNSCFSCISVLNTTCAWDLQTGSCVNLNITDLLLNPENYGFDPKKNITAVVYKKDDADHRCVANRNPGSKVGIIVGVIAGVAALSALIALAAVFGGRLRQIAQRIFGSTGASGSAATKVLDNPTYEVALSQENTLYK
jgi:hypothetical protein